MKLNVIREEQAATCAGIGVAGALIFLFAFPKGSISTLMHAVLSLPGPGAGIALVFGPFLILVALISSLLTQGDGAAAFASLVFAAAYSLALWLFEIPSNPKGAFGSAVFVAAVALFSVAVEAVMVFGKGLKKVWRCMLSGALANVILLVFYWTVIFPRTAEWINRKDIPLLMGLCLVSGLASGWIAWAVSRPLSRVFALRQEE